MPSVPSFGTQALALTARRRRCSRSFACSTGTIGREVRLTTQSSRPQIKVSNLNPNRMLPVTRDGEPETVIAGILPTGETIFCPRHQRVAKAHLFRLRVPRANSCGDGRIDTLNKNTKPIQL